MSPYKREKQLSTALRLAGFPHAFKVEATKLGIKSSPDVAVRIQEYEAACLRLGVEIPAPVEPEPEPSAAVEDEEPEGGWEAADFTGPDASTIADAPRVPDTLHTANAPDTDHTVNRLDVADTPAKARRAATRGEQEQRIVSWLFNILDDIAPALPAEVSLGYLHCWRLADWQTGEFYVSHERMAERLGAANRSTGKRVMRTLVAAGVVKIKVKGKKGQATLYRLAPRSAFKRERVIAAVVSTWMKLNPRMLTQETGSWETHIVSEDGSEGDT